MYKGGYNICFQRSVSVLHTMIFNHYLKTVFDSAFFQNKVNSESTGTAQKGFYLNQLSECLIPVPPIAEQRRIYDKLLEILPCISTINSSKLLFLKQSLSLRRLKQAFIKPAILSASAKLVPFLLILMVRYSPAQS